MKAPLFKSAVTSPIRGIDSRLQGISLSLALLVLIYALLSPASAADQPRQTAQPLELTHAVQPWNFLSAVGQSAGIFGYENGTFEAWVYPLKIFRDFHLAFRLQEGLIPGRAIARTVTVRPESTTILYAYDQFNVRETIFVPVHEKGVIIRLEIDSYIPLAIEARLTRDFQLMWPAGLGGTYEFWDRDLSAFVMGEEQQKFFAVVGSPRSSELQREYVTNYGMNLTTAFRLEQVSKGRSVRYIVIAGSVEGRSQAESTYKHLLDAAEQLQAESAAYYRDYLDHTVSVELPDRELQQAYDWARVSVVQGMVRNPYLGTGLVAGYRISGETARPGFAWFFGRDSEWTDLALTAEGDFSNTRQALEFIMKYQREDGKVPHEISQSASFVNWFKGFPYGFASADATPLLIIAADDYVSQSGDVAFARDHWDNLWRAHQFLESTNDSEGFPRNEGIGHGWVEGGPLLPVRSELYQSGLALESLRALANLAKLTGKADIARQLETNFSQRSSALNSRFWVADKSQYAFAIGTDGKAIAVPSVLAMVPMWMGVLDPAKSNQMIDAISGADHLADWGMRIVSSSYDKYDPSGYHYGAVWPLFTGWASVGSYRYHRPLQGFENLRANALLTLKGSAPGHTTEVLSGEFFQQHSIASPHQIWSAAMVISPLLRGLMGLSRDAASNTLSLAPHVPADWNSFTMRNVRLREGSIDLAYSAAADATGGANQVIQLEVRRSGGGQDGGAIEFAPAISLRAEVSGAEINDRPVPFKMHPSLNDQHVQVRVPLFGGPTTVRIRLRHDFGIAVPVALPEAGGRSRNLKVVSESWSQDHNQVRYTLAGLAGDTYVLPIRGAEEIKNIDGGRRETRDGKDFLTVSFPAASPAEYIQQQVTIQFVPAGSSAR